MASSDDKAMLLEIILVLHEALAQKVDQSRLVLGHSQDNFRTWYLIAQAKAIYPTGSEVPALSKTLLLASGYVPVVKKP